MRTYNQGNPGRRRHGSRRPPRQDGRSAQPSTRSSPQPKSLWQKIVAFFSGPAEPARHRSGAASRPRSLPVQDVRGANRKPEQVEVTSPKLYIGNLSFDATESDLFDLFNGVGKVQTAEVVSHRDTQRSKGFAFVRMADISEARRAVEELHDKEFMGRKLVVSGAKSGGDER